MPSEPPSALLDRVRKLLAKAEAEGVTPPEAEALTAKAAELMARYGIDRALLGAARPETDRPADRKFGFDRPWADVKAHLLAAVATALRCQCVQTQTAQGTRLHVFGYASDLERADILYTSLLLQMARGLTVAVVPDGIRSTRAWRRSWLLGFVTAVITRVRSAEDRAAASSGDEAQSGPSWARPGRSAAPELAVTRAGARPGRSRRCRAGAARIGRTGDRTRASRGPRRARPERREW